MLVVVGEDEEKLIGISSTGRQSGHRHPIVMGKQHGSDVPAWPIDTHTKATQTTKTLKTQTGRACLARLMLPEWCAKSTSPASVVKASRRDSCSISTTSRASSCVYVYNINKCVRDFMCLGGMCVWVGGG